VIQHGGGPHFGRENRRSSRDIWAPQGLVGTSHHCPYNSEDRRITPTSMESKNQKVPRGKTGSRRGSALDGEKTLHEVFGPNQQGGGKSKRGGEQKSAGAGDEGTTG